MQGRLGAVVLSVLLAGVVARAQEEAPAAAEPAAEPVAAPAVSEPLVVDGFEFDQNVLRGRSGQYQREPSRIFATRSAEFAREGKRSLKIKYDKKGVGGPFGKGGWCGVWTQFKVGSQYFDGSSYTKLSFWVKGMEGGEDFKVGLADMHWDKQEDSVKSQDVSNYISGGRVSTEWQQVVIPLEEWFLDHKQLASLAFCFEADSYTDGAQSGIVFIDDIELLK